MARHKKSVIEAMPSIEQLIFELDEHIYHDNISEEYLEFIDKSYENYKISAVKDHGITLARLLELNGLLNYLYGYSEESVNSFDSAFNEFDEDEYYISRTAHEVMVNAYQAEARMKWKKKNARVRNVVIGLVAAWICVGVVADSDAAVVAFGNQEMSRLADQAGMNQHGKAMFLRTDPEIISTEEIKGMCAEDLSTNTVEFGCFLPSENKIYIRDMPSDFDAVEMVTASHEMLHAAAHRSGLSSELSDLLFESASANASNIEFQDAIKVYANLAEDVRLNELHSIIGTELDTLPEDLLNYYATFFEYRHKTVDANKKAQAIFDDKTTAINQLSAAIDIAQANSENYYGNHVYAARSGNRYNTNYYWNLYTAEFERGSALITEYNAKIDEYNSLQEQFSGKPFEEKTINLEDQQ